MSYFGKDGDPNQYKNIGPSRPRLLSLICLRIITLVFIKNQMLK